MFFPAYVRLAFLLAVATVTCAHLEDDFAFELTDDLQVEFGARTARQNNETLAFVGRVFQLIVPKEAHVQSFEAKRHSGKGLPSWLLFDKKTGVFWGVPLSEDVGTLHITVKGIGKKIVTQEFIISVTESSKESQGLEKCAANEDNTILTLLLDKNIRAIKPKQRVVAVNNVAKFFGLPYSAFTLKPQLERDDITDSSVVLAGPGNLRAHTSKVTSLLQVPVGCDGRIWVSAAPMVHQLKQQAKDGTIAEVLRLPLIGWRVKTETRPVVRAKRQTLRQPVDDYGSGDYGDGDDYYDEYDEYDDDLGDVEGNPPTTKLPITLPPTKPPTATTTTTTEIPVTHPHRHHHGEIKPEDENNSSDSVIKDHQTHTAPRVLVTEEITSTTTTSTTSTTTEEPTVPSSTTTTTTTTVPPIIVSEASEPRTTKVVPPKSTQPAVNYGEDYDYGAYDDDEDDIEGGPIESETVVPYFAGKQTIPPSFEDTESITTEAFSTRTTTENFYVPSNTTTTSTTRTSTATSTTSSTTSTTEQPTTFRIVVDTETDEDFEISEATTLPTLPPTTVLVTTTQGTIMPIVLSTTTTRTTLPPSTTTEFMTTNEETTSPVKVTTVRHISSTPGTTTTIREITEGVEYIDKNFKPYIENRLQQMSVMAGKIFRFVIPQNTFKDAEDGYNLTLEFLDANEKPITKNSWLQFNPTRKELYGLPLEEDVSKWVYYIRAVDKEGAYEQDRITIQVQQHKLARVVNHEFSLHIRIEKPQEFPYFIDWSLKVLRALGKIYNTNMSEITVRNVNHTNQPVVFTWSNDSIPTNYCPKTEIEQLYKVLTANDRGDPSRELNLALAPELRVKKVLYHELGVCEKPQTPVTPPMNFSPILRNPVDHVNATVGELLVYKVKDDTFYDPEDVDPRMLNISLLTGDRQTIAPTNWLQFDNKNREFFGIPRKAGRSEYQLVCVDSGGLPATDSLEVVVYPPQKRHYNVEFSMTILVPYDTFANSAYMQKKFVEKVMELFKEPTSNNFHFHPFKPKEEATVITWFNKSLPIEKCATEEIKRLESVLRNNDHSVANRVHVLMEPEFPVSTIKVHPIANCKPKQTIPTMEVLVPVEETTPPSSGDEYLMTFIVPAVIIAVMLFLAAIAACVLYRRRRTGKMNVEEDGRQSYGNKGIPVIFQEELEEKPETGTKAPVILKDEKPPLAPPEYSKSGSVKLDDSEPYQPPPPFTRTQDNGRQSRPKPTPTYRKPPPYVPP